MKRWIAWLCGVGCIAVLACTTLYLFREPILLQFIRWQFEKQTAYVFGEPLVADAIVVDQHQVTITHPHLVDREGASVEAEALVIRGSFWPWDVAHQLEVELLAPIVTLDLEKGKLSQLGWTMPKGGGLRRGHWKLTDGVVRLVDSGREFTLCVEGRGNLRHHG